MTKFIFKLVLVSMVGLLLYVAYETYRKGYLNIPDMPEGSYAVSEMNGLRGIVLDAEVTDPSISDMPKFLRRINFANPDRLYFALPFQVAPWIENAWSTCTSPSDEERANFSGSLPEDVKRQVEHARFESVCRVQVDDAEVVRGLLYSVPKL